MVQKLRMVPYVVEQQKRLEVLGVLVVLVVRCSLVKWVLEVPEAHHF